MPRDLDGLADVVVLTVKTALGPVLERLAVMDARLAIAAGAEQAVTEMRDRIVALETKAAMSRPPDVNLDAALAPLLERLASVDTMLATLPATEQTVTDLRERVVTVETKAAMPAVLAATDVGLTPLLERLASVETTLATIPATEQTLADVRDRVIACETKAAIPLLPDPTVGDLRERVVAVEMHAGDAVDALRARMTATETRLATIDDVRDRLTSVETKADRPAPEPAIGDVRDRLVILEMQTASAAEATGDLKARVSAVEHRVQDDGLTKTVAAISERVAVVEVRGQVPGPPGKDGKDGADGLGFEDLDVQFDGDRTIALKFERGLIKKSFPIALPFLRYHGVYIDGKSYAEGDVVTWAGSTWTAQTVTSTKPGDGSKDWILAVKRGRDGKDGRDAPGALPIVSVGRVS